MVLVDKTSEQPTWYHFRRHTNRFWRRNDSIAFFAFITMSGGSLNTLVGSTEGTTVFSFRQKVENGN